MKNIYSFLKERGYIYQQTNPEKIEEILSDKNKITFYLGIDPTANSLHIGHFFALMIFRYLQEAGHKGILLIGGATALIPDPTGKQELRKILTKEEVQNNIKEVENLCKHFIITEGDNAALILNNNDWLGNQKYIDFMRDIGIHFNVNTMLKTEAYADRLKEGGLTFLEMGYMLMQSYDFKYLFEKYNCILQIGGSDQWANILGGYDLIRKTHNEEVLGLTCPLLVDSSGKKMGKTDKGTLWVAKDKTSVYDFYQYWININDKDVEPMLRLLTKIDLDEIKDMCQRNIVEAKKRMAFEVTKMIHGEEQALFAKKTAEELFEKKRATDDAPTIIVDDFGTEINILDLLVKIELVFSKSAAKRLIEQGGIRINQQKINDIDLMIKRDDINDGLLIQKGKKVFIKVKIKS